MTVYPKTATVDKGGSQTFTATVTGTNSPAQTVTWSITPSGTASGISNSGVLLVAANETNTTLTVKATSAVDTSVSGTATVTVIDTRAGYSGSVTSEPTEAVRDRSAKPTADVTSVKKISIIAATAAFTLTSTNTGAWKVYDDGATTTVSTAVKVKDFNTAKKELTLSSHDETSALTAGTYYVTVTEDGKTESGRLALSVTTPGQSVTPAASVTSVTKTSAAQTPVDFTLTTAPAGTWAVYNHATEDTHPDGVSVTVSGMPLSLSKEGGVPHGNYWVTVTETGKTGSARLGLTVVAYYYVVVTNTNNSVNGTKTAAATSSVAAVRVCVTVAGIEDYLTGLEGDGYDAPYTIDLSPLTTIDTSDTSEEGVWDAINTKTTSAEKYVVLDLSACTAKTGTLSTASAASAVPVTTTWIS